MESFCPTTEVVHVTLFKIVIKPALGIYPQRFYSKPLFAFAISNALQKSAGNAAQKCKGSIRRIKGEKYIKKLFIC